MIGVNIKYVRLKITYFYNNTGNSQSLEEVKNAKGVSSVATFKNSGWVYLAEAFGNDNKYLQTDNFRVGTYDQIYPKIRLVDDVTTWLPGKKYVCTLHSLLNIRIVCS